MKESEFREREVVACELEANSRHLEVQANVALAAANTCKVDIDNQYQLLMKQMELIKAGVAEEDIDKALPLNN